MDTEPAFIFIRVVVQGSGIRTDQLVLPVRTGPRPDTADLQQLHSGQLVLHDIRRSVTYLRKHRLFYIKIAHPTQLLYAVTSLFLALSTIT
jgi:hypothetical protein